MDNGHDVLFKLPPALQEKVELIVLRDTKEFPVAIDTCLKIVSGAAISICDAHGQVACSTCKRDPKAIWTALNMSAVGLDTVIVFDHISQLADSAMNFITKKKDDDYFPEWSDFRLQGILMSKFLMNIQQAPYHAICIAQMCETEMDDGSKRLVPLVGTVPFSRGAGKYFDHVICSRLGNKKHLFGSNTTYSITALTGSRSDIAIEEQKEGRPTLLPFFDGTMVSQKEEQDGEALRQLNAISTGSDDRHTNNVDVVAPAVGSPQERARERLAALRARNSNL